MRSLPILIFLLGAAQLARAQGLPIPALISLLDKPADSVETILKKKDFFLVEKNIDSSSAYYYYNTVEKDKNNIAWVRSLSMMDARRGKFTGRLLSYRTYEAAEYKKMLQYLLVENYATEQQFRFGSSRHTIYRKNGLEIRLKVTDEKLADGRPVRAYEVEMGK